MNGEIVPIGTSEKAIEDEVNRRTHKAGYTDRDGQMLDRRGIRSKPATPQYRENYDRIFGHK